MIALGVLPATSTDSTATMAQDLESLVAARLEVAIEDGDEDDGEATARKEDERGRGSVLFVCTVCLVCLY